MRDLIRPLLLMGAVLAVPIIPFLAFGTKIEVWAASWSQQPGTETTLALAIFGLLVSDFILPVPSSLLSTLGGWRLGWLVGTVVSWSGMSVGAILGFAVALRWGQPIASRLSRREQLNRFAMLAYQYGPVAIVICRGVPVLAEASILWMGIHGLSWKRFLPPVLLANLGIAFVYSAFGKFAAEHRWLPLALGVSVALPILLMLLLSRVSIETKSTREIEVGKKRLNHETHERHEKGNGM